MPSLLQLLLVWVISTVGVHAIQEPRTGLDFPAQYQGADLSKLGVRNKGPIKVYAVGQYDDTFLLKMNMKVGAAKMASAMGDALKPRCGDEGCIAEFKDVMTKGLPNGCSKGMSLAFVCSGGKVSMLANDKSIGCVDSQQLATAFQGIYTDKNAVCKMNPV